MALPLAQQWVVKHGLAFVEPIHEVDALLLVEPIHRISNVLRR
jgi:hypothetical protein